MLRQLYTLFAQIAAIHIYPPLLTTLLSQRIPQSACIAQWLLQNPAMNLYCGTAGNL